MRHPGSPPTPARGRALRVVGALAVLGLLAVTFTPLPNAVAHRLATGARLGRADAIVVLGSRVHADGTLNASSLRRAVHGMRLYHEGWAPRLVFTGPGEAGGPTEALARATLARALRVPPPAILIDEQARTTGQEARRVAALLAPLGAKSVLLVTAPLHMTRAQALFEQAGLRVFPAPVSEGIMSAYVPEDRLELARHVVTELAAHVYYRLTGALVLGR